VTSRELSHWETFDGRRLAYHDEGSGPAVVLLHGFAADLQRNWVDTGVVAALVGAGRRVIATDARGHGASDHPHDPRDYDDDAMIRDVQSLFDHLGVASADLVGYSMGAMMAAGVAARDPRVHALVLGGVGGRWSGAQHARDNLPIADGLVAEDATDVTDPVARAFRRFADGTGADRVALAACMRSTRGERIDLGAITVPTLVLAGDADTLVGSPEPLAGRIPGARFEVLHGDHLRAIYDPRFVAAIVEFLGEADPV